MAPEVIAKIANADDSKLLHGVSPIEFLSGMYGPYSLCSPLTDHDIFFRIVKSGPWFLSGQSHGNG
jgi:hypothetical protein